MTRDMIKECEENCVKIAKEMSDMLEVVNAMQSFGNNFMDEYGGQKDRYFKGLQEVRYAVYAQYVEMISRCFMFTDVGRGKAAEYSRQQFHKHFNEEERYCVSHFLDEYGQIPGWMKEEDEKLLRKQASEIEEAE